MTLSLYGQHSKSWPKIFKRLVELRDKAIAENKPVETRWAGVNWFVMNYYPGDLEGKLRPDVTLTRDGITMRFSECGEYSEKQHNAWVEVGSLPFLSFTDWRWVMNFFVFERLKKMGFDVRRASPTRVDACWDTHGFSMALVGHLYKTDCYVTRTEYHGMPPGKSGHQTVQFGKRPHDEVRIYDKWIECVNGWNKQGEAKWNLIEAKRYGGVHPDHAVRVEIENRRDTLRDKFGINHWHEYEERAGSVAEYMLEKYARLTANPPDRINRHQARAETHPWWQDVQASAAAMFAGRTSSFQAHIPKPVTASKLFNIGTAYFFSGFAKQGRRFADEGELIEAVDDEFLRNMPPDWKERLEQKLLREDIRRTAKPYQYPSEEVEEFITGDIATVSE